MTPEPWTWRRGDGPVLATAIHAGHDLRSEVATLTALTDAQRLREEDPYSDRWTAVAGTSVVVHRSRWEVDLNRERARAVYLQPEDCWGLPPWSTPPSEAFLARSRDLYDRFYAELAAECDRILATCPAVVVLDLHSYNHRRDGPDAPPANAVGNPDVNIGTRSLDRRAWAGLVDRFAADVRADGLDVRENVRFGGATLARWLHQRYPGVVACLAVDVKKIFMDEHTGTLDEDLVGRVSDAIARAVPGLVEETARR
jgi:N-formylglutamate amidohydrolase